MTFRNPLINREGDHIGKILLTRTIFATIVVFAIWNPSGFSYIDWVMATWGQSAEWLTIIMIVIGAMLGFSLVIATIFMLKRLTLRAFVAGAMMVLLLFVCLQFLGRWDLQGAGQILLWLGLLAVALLLGLGLSGRELHNFHDRLRPHRR